MFFRELTDGAPPCKAKRRQTQANALSVHRANPLLASGASATKPEILSAKSRA